MKSTFATKPKLIVIVGPTAVGKTKAAIELAQKYETEIISADSRQFYIQMNIGTAKPTPSQLATIPHHFVDFLDIDTYYSCGDFERDVIAKLQFMFKNHNTIVMVGGSGLFIKAVCEGIDYMPAENLEVRNQLNNEFKTNGLTSLLDQLQRLDPDYFLQIDQHNSQRIVRALEVCITSGKPYSSFRTGQLATRNFEIIKIGLTQDRQLLYNKINQRVDTMLADGLEAEALALYPHKHKYALQTVGYQEFFDYFDGLITKQEAINAIKQNTRRFAKRQMTWFQKDKNITWIEAESKDFLKF